MRSRAFSAALCSACLLAGTDKCLRRRDHPHARAVAEWLVAASKGGAATRSEEGSAEGALDALLCGVVQHARPSALKGRCLPLLQALLPLALEEASGSEEGPCCACPRAAAV